MPGTSYLFGAFRIDTNEQCLHLRDIPQTLTPKAFDTLLVLVQEAGHMVTREELLRRVWPDSFVEENNLSQNISQIRRAFDREGCAEYIETVPKRGYRFVAPVKVIETTRQQGPAWARLADDLGVEIPQTRYARSGDVEIAYQVVGDGPIDLVFVMGWISHLEYFWREPSFARFLRRLASFSRLILFDKRGTGLSDRVPPGQLPTLEQRMDDLRAVVEAVGAERVAIMGVSEGGPMSALFAATYPEKTSALVMIGTYARRLRDADYPWGPTAAEREEYIREIREHWGGPVGVEERAPSMAKDPRFREWWAEYLRNGASPSAAAALTWMNAEIDVRRVLPTVRVPTLVIHRQGDQCLRVEEGRLVAALIPGARFVELPGDDHLPFVGDQEEMLEQVEVFLGTVSNTHGPERVLATVLFVRVAQGVQPESAMARAIERQIEWNRGRVLDLLGPGPMATFDGPARAIRCAMAIVRAARVDGLTAACGLHTGECDKIGDKHVGGVAVEIASRVAAEALPDSVVVTNTVKDLVAGSGIVFGPGEGLSSVPHLPDLRAYRVVE